MRDKILPLICLILLVFSALGFLYFFERYETDVYSGYSAKAFQNRYLAAEQFLQRLDKEVDSSKQSLEFGAIDADQVVFLSKVNSIVVTTRQVDKAMGWLRSGGEMIVGVGAKTGSKDTLLSRLDVTAEDNRESSFWNNDETDEKFSDQLKRRNDEIEKSKNASSEKEEVENLDEDTEEALGDEYDEPTFTINFDNKNEVKVRSSDDVILSHSDLHESYSDHEELGYEIISWAGNDNGLHLIQFQIGEGMLTVLSSSDIWTNYNIDEMDNAYALAELVGTNNKVSFFFNLDVPSIKERLMEFFPEASLLFLGGLLLWIWRGLIRTSLVRDNENDGRRVLSEHLAATSELFIKHGRFDLLVAPVVSEVEDRMINLVEGFNSFNNDQKIESVAEHSGIEQSYIRDWYQLVQNVEDNDVFVRVVKIGKMIRNKI